MTKIEKLVNEGRIVIKHTRRQHIPYALIDGKEICEKDLLDQYGFTDFWHLKRWAQIYASHIICY